MQKNIYQLIEPCDELKPYVRRFMLADCKDLTQFYSPAKPTGYQYLGWVIGDNILTTVDGLETFLDDGYFHISGQIEHQEIQLRYAGDFIHILAEFTAAGLYQLTKINGDSCKGKLQDFFSLKPEFSDACKALHNQANKALTDKKSEQAFVLLQNFLLSLIPHSNVIPDYLTYAINEIEQTHGKIHISEISKNIDVSQRQLNRKFAKIVGVSPKFFARVLQLNRAVQAMLENDTDYMLEAAQQCGFYDQAHFGKVMQEFFMSSPLEFLHNDEHMLFDF